MDLETKITVGVATLVLLRHWGFSVVHCDADRFALSETDVVQEAMSPVDRVREVEVLLSAEVTTVSRCVYVADLWEDSETILAAAMSAREFLLNPSRTL